MILPSREHALLLSFVWTIGLLAVFAPLAVRRYRSIELALYPRTA